jgi:arylsulfatase A-like enzyme
MLVDWDGDGYASLLGGSDCAPFDPKIHPGAREIPDNGIDENCVLGDAKKPSDKLELPPPPAANDPSPLDVVLITVDAFSPSHLGLYNPDYGPKGRNTSPNLDHWAEQAMVFEHAYSPGGWTSVAVPSLLRGVYARRLRWTKYFETNLYALLRRPLEPKLRPGERAMQMFPLAFGDPHPTLAELLARRGMYTMAITDDGYSAMLERGTGVERGFRVYRQVDQLPEGLRNDIGTANTAIEMLANAPTDRRLFMWVHFFGTHFPDEYHPGTRVYGNRPTDRYDHEVAFLDTQLVRLLDALAARKHPVAVFVSADHGEGLTAFSRTHGLTLDEQVIRIPLLARVPGWPVERVKQLVSSLDLVPTILALTHTPAPTFLDGIDLQALERAPRDRVLFSDTWRFNPHEKLDVDLAAAYDGTRKVILDHVTGNLYSVSQTELQAPPRLLGSLPTDALSGAVFAYIEETGELRLRD